MEDGIFRSMEGWAFRKKERRAVCNVESFFLGAYFNLFSEYSVML